MKPPVQSSPGADFANDSDADLFGAMALQGEDEDFAKAAFVEFYHRYASWLLRRLRRVRAVHLIATCEEDLKDLVNDTMLRAYQRAGQLNTDIADPMLLSARVKAWLSRIASRLALTRGRTLVPTDLFEDFEDFPSSTGDPATDPPAPPSDEVEAMAEAIECLTMKEQDVVRTYISYERPGVTHQRLPNSVSSALAERCGTTAAGVRMTHMRAKAKLEKAFTEALTRRRESRRSS